MHFSSVLYFRHLVRGNDNRHAHFASILDSLHLWRDNTRQNERGSLACGTLLCASYWCPESYSVVGGRGMSGVGSLSRPPWTASHRRRLHAVGDRNHKDDDIGRSRTAMSHRCEELMARGVDEGDRLICSGIDGEC